MVIIHKIITTFGYKQIVYLETCLNLSILWFLTIFYCKNLTKYILNLIKKILLQCYCLLKLAKVGFKKNKIK